MIDYLSGPLAEKTPAYVVVDCGGVGYEVNITLIDYGILERSESAKLYIQEAIREDAHLLYGFLDRESRELFRMLIGVSGVGPNTARLILSALSPSQLQGTIASGDAHALKAVKGIGAKTAERIIIDLKDKINAAEGTLSLHTPVTTESYEEALAALVMLGFTAPQSQKALRKLYADNSGLTAEQAIKLALKML